MTPLLLGSSEGSGGVINRDRNYRKIARAKERKIKSKNKKYFVCYYRIFKRVYIDLLSSKISLL